MSRCRHFIPSSVGARSSVYQVKSCTICSVSMDDLMKLCFGDWRMYFSTHSLCWYLADCDVNAGKMKSSLRSSLWIFSAWPCESHKIANVHQVWSIKCLHSMPSIQNCQSIDASPNMLLRSRMASSSAALSSCLRTVCLSSCQYTSLRNLLVRHELTISQDQSTRHHRLSTSRYETLHIECPPSRRCIRASV